MQQEQTKTKCLNCRATILETFEIYWQIFFLWSNRMRFNITSLMPHRFEGIELSTQLKRTRLHLRITRSLFIWHVEFVLHLRITRSLCLHYVTLLGLLVTLEVLSCYRCASKDCLCATPRYMYCTQKNARLEQLDSFQSVCREFSKACKTFRNHILNIIRVIKTLLIYF